MTMNAKMAVFGVICFLTWGGSAVCEEKAPEDVVWTDLRTLGVEGKGWENTLEFYDRLPPDAEKSVPKPVWDLSRHSAGLSARFVTASPRLWIRWTLRGETRHPHMPDTGASGVDLYRRMADGTWDYQGTGFPRTPPTHEAKFELGATPTPVEFLLHLPLYNGVKSVEVGVPAGQAVGPAPARPADRRKPLAFYGTSITQGGCASRPGMAWVSIVGRRLDRSTVNLGFSGSAKMEPELATLLAQFDAEIFVLCPVENMNCQLISERAESFVRTLRAAHPKTPILLAEESQIHPGRPDAKNKLWRAVYEKLAPGDPALHYLSCDEMLGRDGEATVDGLHPSDLGMLRMADAYAPVLARILKGERNVGRETPRPGTK